MSWASFPLMSFGYRWQLSNHPSSNLCKWPLSLAHVSSGHAFPMSEENNSNSQHLLGTYDVLAPFTGRPLWSQSNPRRPILQMRTIKAQRHSEHIARKWQSQVWNLGGLTPWSQALAATAWKCVQTRQNWAGFRILELSREGGRQLGHHLFYFLDFCWVTSSHLLFFLVCHAASLPSCFIFPSQTSETWGFGDMKD